jgi:hypothetical protein
MDSFGDLSPSGFEHHVVSRSGEHLCDESDVASGWGPTSTHRGNDIPAPPAVHRPGEWCRDPRFVRRRTLRPRLVDSSAALMYWLVSELKGIGRMRSTVHKICLASR